MKASALGELRNNHDPCLTYEGDNNVLGQQGSNWLLRQWTNLESPLGSINFLKRRDEILQQYSFESLKELHHKNFFECKWIKLIKILFKFNFYRIL